MNFEDNDNVLKKRDHLGFDDLDKIFKGNSTAKSPNFWEEFSKISSAIDSARNKLQSLKSHKSPTAIDTLSLDKCVEIANQERIKYPQISAFILEITRNDKYKGNSDILLITLTFLDKSNQPVFLPNHSINQRLIHAKTIDMQLITALNGNASMLFKIERI